MKSITIQQADRQKKSKIQCDTYVYPLLQMALFGVRTEESFVKHLLQTASDGVKISLATGYFNLTKHYQNIIVLESSANFDLLIASPQVLLFLCKFIVMVHVI
jgi:hypothetical protein